MKLKSDIKHDCFCSGYNSEKSIKFRNKNELIYDALRLKSY